MSRKTAAVMLFIILDALAFAAGVWITFGHDLWHVVRIEYDMIRRILFLAALPFPLLFVFRHFRDRYGVDMAHFCLYSLLPPFCVLVITSVVLYAVAAATADGWGGLAVMGLIVILYGITFVLLFISLIWVYVGQLFENIKTFRGTKSFLGHFTDTRRSGYRKRVVYPCFSLSLCSCQLCIYLEFYAVHCDHTLQSRCRSCSCRDRACDSRTVLPR